MCGLTFLYHEALSEEELRQRVGSALRRIVHRGPDDEGMHCSPPMAVGHRRLSVIDLQASRQPMMDPGGRYVLAYNGEVYNYRDLRQRLTGRWRFRTQGDTEVVLAGLVSLGADFLRQMEGMWALVLWDSVGRRLLAARDRMGKKPLFYKGLSDGLACASELAALAQLSDSPWSEDLDSTADYLRYGFYLPGTTAYRGVSEVRPGNVLTWSPGSVPRSTAYWSLSTGGFSGGRGFAEEQIREKLRAAIERRLVADVEVGAFLSGGIDSSLIVSILSRQCGISVKTFTVGFPEVSYDEREFARQVARVCQADHHEECLERWDPEQLKKLVLSHVGQPFADSSLLPTALVSEVAARHVKVALSGDGGDELFSGYQRYQARAILRWYTRLPRFVRGSVERLVRVIPEPMAHHSRSVLKKANLFLEVARRHESETPYIAPLMYSHEQFAGLAPELVGRGHVPPGLPDEAKLDELEAMMARDALIYLPQDILVKVDRSSMAYSLEARAPFLDREIVELAFSLPRRWHRRGFSGKRMLRQAFADMLPSAIWRRRKQGFAVPIQRWFRSALGSELEQLLEQTLSPVRKPFVHDLLKAHRNGRRDYGNRLWAIYIYLLWQQHRSEF